MFFLRSVTKLVSLPPLWLGQLLMMLKMPLCVPFLRMAWAISGDGGQGRLVILAIRQFMGPEVGLAAALQAMGRRPCPQIAAWAGLLAIIGGDLETARTMLIQGRLLGDDSLGELDLLEMYVVLHDPNRQTVQETALRFDARRDLQPGVSKLVAAELMWSALLAGRQDETRRRAEHVLKVEEVPDARMALWAVETMAGNQVAAKAHYERAKLTEAWRVHYELLGNVAMGDMARARHLHEQLQELDPGLAGLAARRLACAEGASC